MSEQPSGKAGQISWMQLLIHFGLTAVASLILWLVATQVEDGWWLRLTQRIIWGVWFVNALATTLTHVTIFGWSFRRYVRWAGDRFRATKAPWTKSGKASFSFTVAMVSVTGAIALVVVVFWILKPVTGDFTFRVILTVFGSVWWVTMIVLVLVRVALFGTQRQRELGGDSSGVHS